MLQDSDEDYTPVVKSSRGRGRSRGSTKSSVTVAHKLQVEDEADADGDRIATSSNRLVNSIILCYFSVEIFKSL